MAGKRRGIHHVSAALYPTNSRCIDTPSSSPLGHTKVTRPETTTHTACESNSGDKTFAMCTAAEIPPPSTAPANAMQHAPAAGCASSAIPVSATNYFLIRRDLKLPKPSRENKINRLTETFFHARRHSASAPHPSPSSRCCRAAAYRLTIHQSERTKPSSKFDLNCITETVCHLATRSAERVPRSRRLSVGLRLEPVSQIVPILLAPVPQVPQAAQEIARQVAAPSATSKSSQKLDIPSPFFAARPPTALAGAQSKPNPNLADCNRPNRLHAKWIKANREYDLNRLTETTLVSCLLPINATLVGNTRTTPKGSGPATPWPACAPGAAGSGLRAALGRPNPAPFIGRKHTRVKSPFVAPLAVFAANGTFRANSRLECTPTSTHDDPLPTCRKRSLATSTANSQTRLADLL